MSDQSAEIARPLCPFSKRMDGRHAWVFDGDDPYVICHFCQEMRDAQTDRVIRPGNARLDGSRDV